MIQVPHLSPAVGQPLTRHLYKLRQALAARKQGLVFAGLAGGLLGLGWLYNQERESQPLSSAGCCCSSRISLSSSQLSSPWGLFVFEVPLGFSMVFRLMPVCQGLLSSQMSTVIKVRVELRSYCVPGTVNPTLNALQRGLLSVFPSHDA